MGAYPWGFGAQKWMRGEQEQWGSPDRGGMAQQEDGVGVAEGDLQHRAIFKAGQQLLAALGAPHQPHIAHSRSDLPLRLHLPLKCPQLQLPLLLPAGNLLECSEKLPLQAVVQDLKHTDARQADACMQSGGPPRVIYTLHMLQVHGETATV